MHDGTAEQHVYALVGEGEAPPVHLLPATNQTLALLEAAASPLHFWRCNATAGASMLSSWTLPRARHGLWRSSDCEAHRVKASSCSMAIWHERQGA